MILSWILKDNKISFSWSWWHVPIIPALGGRDRRMKSLCHPEYVGKTSQTNKQKQKKKTKAEDV